MFTIYLTLGLLLCQGGLPQNNVLPLRVSHGPKDQSWWCWAEFEPVHKTISGIPINEIDRSWAYASELNLNSIPRRFFSDAEGENPGARGMVCSRKGDFNHDGVPDLALVGVYKTVDGNFGNFFLILTKASPTKWRVAFKKLMPGKSGFLMIPRDSKELEVWPCLDCDAGSTISWNAKSHRYIWEDSSD